MYKFLIVAFVSLSLCQVLTPAAQYRVGIEGPIPVGELNEMEDALSLADAHQKADLLARIGVDPAIAKAAAEQLLAREKIELRPIRTREDVRYGLAFLPSGSYPAAYLYLLEDHSAKGTKKISWRVIDGQTLDCWSEFCSYEMMPLRKPDEDDIVLHHVNAGHGSGFVKNETIVFTIVNGKLLRTLATTDYFLSRAMAGTNTLETKSTFLRFPDNSLEETRTSGVNDKLTKVERRYWRWSEARHTLNSSNFLLAVPPDGRAKE